MLFITNGDSAAGRIGASGLAGGILPWRDVLHEGPVPGGLSAEELADVRARFLAERGWTTLARAKRDFVRRDATLAGYRNHEEVVLFFEHDLYDQLQLIQVLDWFSRRDLEDTRLSIVHAARMRPPWSNASCRGGSRTAQKLAALTASLRV